MRTNGSEIKCCNNTHQGCHIPANKCALALRTSMMLVTLLVDNGCDAAVMSVSVSGDATEIKLRDLKPDADYFVKYVNLIARWLLLFTASCVLDSAAGALSLLSYIFISAEYRAYVIGRVWMFVFLSLSLSEREYVKSTQLIFTKPCRIMDYCRGKYQIWGLINLRMA